MYFRRYRHKYCYKYPTRYLYIKTAETTCEVMRSVNINRFFSVSRKVTLPYAACHDKRNNWIEVRRYFSVQNVVYSCAVTSRTIWLNKTLYTKQ